LQQRAIAVTRHTTIELFRRGSQVDNDATRVEMVAVFRREHRAAAGGQHQIGPGGAFLENLPFAPAEPFFTFNVENVSDTDTATAFDLMIEVQELTAERTREAPADGGLARTH